MCAFPLSTMLSSRAHQPRWSLDNVAVFFWTSLLHPKCWSAVTTRAVCQPSFFSPTSRSEHLPTCFVFTNPPRVMTLSVTDTSLAVPCKTSLLCRAVEDGPSFVGLLDLRVQPHHPTTSCRYVCEFFEDSAHPQQSGKYFL